jgi:phosphotriesterase-related protein
MGRTLIDEHVVLGLDGFAYWETPETARLRAHDHAVRALVELREAGVDTIVDTTAIGAGRDPGLLREVSEESGITIILGVGVGTGGVGVPRAFAGLSAVDLAAVYLDELNGGLHGGISSAVITVEAGPVAHEFDETLILAAGFAYAETGAPVLARAIGSGSAPLVDRLTARGIDPERILVAGVDSGQASWDALERLASKGVCVGVTGIGERGGLSDDARASLLSFALRVFGGDRVCLSMGSWAYWLGAEGMPRESSVDVHRGFGFFTRFVTRLAAYGVAETHLQAALIDAPRLWLGGPGRP